MTTSQNSNVKEIHGENKNSSPKKKSSAQNKKSSDSSYVRWMSDYQGFLTLVLIGVTAYFGWKNHQGQKVSNELQKVNNELQQSIYSPSFVPTEYIAPQEIDGEFQSTFKVSNHGYIGGEYSIVIKSDTFYLTRRDQVNERSISWGYHVPQSDSSFQEFTIISPSKKIPLHASYHIELNADGYLGTEYHFCYQNIGGRKYKRTSCK